MHKQILAASLAIVSTFVALPSFSNAPQTAAAPTTQTPTQAAAQSSTVTTAVTTPAASVAAPAVATPATTPAGQSAVTDPALTAQVSTVKVEPTALDYLEVLKQDADTAGHSSRKYRAVSITLKNKHAKHVEIVQAEIANALDEALIAQEEQQSKQRKKAFAGALMRGATSFIPYAGYLGASSAYAAAYALSGTSQALNYASYAIENAPGGGLQISNQFVKKVTNVVVSPNQTFTFKVLIPAGNDPQMKVIFKDLETNRILEI